MSDSFFLDGERDFHLGGISQTTETAKLFKTANHKITLSNSQNTIGVTQPSLR